ncbi:MAG: LysE family transporter [Pseudomonadota bacterium]|nr:LysE family transporter [Pseudomonadota bacterium]MEE3100914.1 LysE family transporter [Pseudomonadota bacterium]
MGAISGETWAGFLLASAALIAAPGPNVALILAVASARGFGAGLRTVAGTTAAQGVQIAAAAFGMAWLAEAWGAGFEILRWIGAAWLVRLGVGLWREAGRPVAETAARGRRGRAREAGRGFVVGLANPKSLAFHAAFLPQFADASAPMGPQLAALGAAFVAVAFALDLGWAGLGAGLGAGLSSAGGRLSGPAARAWMARGAGAALIGGAVWLALGRRA